MRRCLSLVLAVLVIGCGGASANLSSTPESDAANSTLRAHAKLTLTGTWMREFKPSDHSQPVTRTSLGAALVQVTLDGVAATEAELQALDKTETAQKDRSGTLKGELPNGDGVMVPFSGPQTFQEQVGDGDDTRLLSFNWSGYEFHGPSVKGEAQVFIASSADDNSLQFGYGDVFEATQSEPLKGSTTIFLDSAKVTGVYQ